MFGAVHFIYYINRFIATKLDSTYLGHQPTAHKLCLVAAGGRKSLTSRSVVRRLADCATQVDKDMIIK